MKRNPLTPWLTICLAPLLALQGLAADIKIEFLPPPMDGTISLGIYNSEGKLVRILHREADTDEFKVALNGLVTRWDGKDDTGAACPPGKYHARGYSVGDLQLDGVDFHGNDWVTDDDSPRITRIMRMAAQPDGTLLVEATVPGESEAKTFIIAPAAAASPETPESAEATETAETTEMAETEGPEWKLKPAPEGTRITASEETKAAGGEIVWTIKDGNVQKTSAGETLLILKAKPDAPPAAQLAFAPATKRLFVLNENADTQVLLGLNTEPDIPEPLFERTIRNSNRVEQVESLLKFSDGKPFAPAASLKVPLIPNPLLRKGSGLAQVKVDVDASGTVLTTLDGLPLTRVSETPHLKWAVIGRSPDAKKRVATIFESDGAVIAEFKAERLDNMMAFDAGLFELKAEAPTPTPTPAAETSETPSGSPTPEAPAEPAVNPAPVISATPAATAPEVPGSPSPAQAPAETP